MSVVNRSVENAMRRPSGDHDGWRSAKASFVRRRSWFCFRSYRYRSVSPPRWPLKAIVLSSGAHAGARISSTSRISISRSREPSSAS